MPEFRTGQIIPLRYKSRELKAVIIDPNGLGPDKPTIGMGFRGMDRHIGIPQPTLSRRVMQIARNYIPEAVGLEAVAYCEKMVAQLDLDDIQMAHDEAIRLTRMKFAKYFPAG